MKGMLDAGREILASILYDSDSEKPSGEASLSHRERWDKGWRRKLNPIQQQAHDDPAIFKLLYGERGSGKSLGGISELVEIAYLNPNALCLVLVLEVSIASDGGAWEKLVLEELPVWKHGNRHAENMWDGSKWVPNPKAGEYMDNGLGLEYTESKLDVQTKKPFVWVQNYYGGWSKIMLISLPVDSHVTKKVKGKEPNGVFVDEAQTMESEGYFKYLAQQLGRRRRAKTKQRIIYGANPDGPSHWLYKKFFIEPLNEETGDWDHRFAKHHIPVSDNLANLPLNYYSDYVLPAVKGDPTEYARMVEGKWVDRPAGRALFGHLFLPKVHVMGDRHKGRGLLPIQGHPIIWSYDLGAAHTSLHTLQIVPDKDQVWKLVLDELNYVGDYIRYNELVPKILRRMLDWEIRMSPSGHDELVPIKWMHISDNSAFNQYRAKDGSFDAWDIEEISRDFVLKNKTNPKWKGLDDRHIIKMIECPKGPHSIEARVRMLRDSLEEASIIISDVCVKTQDMLLRLEEDPKYHFKPNERSPLTHPFDSLTYGQFFFDKRRLRSPATTGKLPPKAYVFGSN